MTYYKKIQTIKSQILWTRGHQRSRDKLKHAISTTTIPMVTKPGRLVIQSHMTLWSSGLVMLIIQFVGLACKYLSLHQRLFAMLVKLTLYDRFAIWFPPSLRLSRNIGEFRAKKYFTDYRTANTIKLVFGVKGSFSGLFFFWASRSEEEFPRG